MLKRIISTSVIFFGLTATSSSKEIVQPNMGELKAIERNENFVTYQSRDMKCGGIVRFTGYLHENGWAIYEKKLSGEQVQIPFAFVSELDTYVDINLDGKFDYRTRLSSIDFFCSILDKESL